MFLLEEVEENDRLFEAMAPQAAAAACSAALCFTRRRVDQSASAGEAAGVLGSGCLEGVLGLRVTDFT